MTLEYQQGQQQHQHPLSLSQYHQNVQCEPCIATRLYHGRWVGLLVVSVRVRARLMVRAGVSVRVRLGLGQG